MPNHTTFRCATKSNIGIISDGDDLVELLQDTCPFKIIIESKKMAMYFVKILIHQKFNMSNANSYYLKAYHILM